MEISDNNFTVSTATGKVSTKQAWALYARRRWPQNAIKHAQAEWDLTDGQARGLVFAQASQSTIDAVLNHPNGGFRLGLLILEIRMQTRLRSWVEGERKRLVDEAERNARASDALAAMAADLGPVLGLGDFGGAVLAAEPRTFAGRGRRQVVP